MEENIPTLSSPKQKPLVQSNKNKYKVYLKAGVLFILILIFAIPMFMVDSLIKERQNRRNDAINEITNKWGEGQTLAGPVLSVPYREELQDSLKRKYWVRRYIHILPNTLKITSRLAPEIRYRSIYEVAVYNSTTSFDGVFDLREAMLLGIDTNNIVWNDAFVSIGITDLRGISEQVSMKWNNQECSFKSGIPTKDVLEQGVYSKIPLSASSPSMQHIFSVQLRFRGSESIQFVPVGKVTETIAQSSWKTPSFTGNFLPINRKIGEEGFSANWKVLHLNRKYPQQWRNSEYSIENSTFGYELLLPIDHFHKSERSIKYGLLFIALTFLMFFFLELLNAKLVHPFQYLLIGLALCVFYTLLISISEHLDYNISYVIAASATIGLITIYSASVLNNRKLAIMIGSTLTMLYGFLFTIIQLEDYAMLIGSIGLFLILAATMYFSKRISWSSLST
jgi:inner membrane protein